MIARSRPHLVGQVTQVSWTERVLALRGLLPALLLFAFVFGGLYLGIFTPTESAGLGAVGALGLAAVLARVMPGIGFAAVTFTTNVVTIRVSWGDLLGGLVLALVIGAGGGIGPAWRAARLRPIDALRRA